MNESNVLTNKPPEGAGHPVYDDVDLRELFVMMWRSRWILCVSTIIAGVIAASVSMVLPNVYRSQALLAPAEQSGGGRLAALAGQFGGLASLAGVNLGGNEINRTLVAMEVLKSRAFVVDFVRRRDILVPLMAAKKWDANSQQLIIDASIYDVDTKKWMADEFDDKHRLPTDWDVYQRFSNVLDVTQAKNSGFVTVSVDFISPVHAKEWVDWLVDDVNTHMRKRDVDEASRSIEYLKQQLEKTSIAGMQQAFYQLIEKQLQTIMLANVRDQYVFKVIDPAAVAQAAVKPKRDVITVGAALGVFLLCSIVVVLKGAMGRRG